MATRLSPSQRLKIIVTGYVVRRPVGGLAWHYLHYVMGLMRLGHDVYYLEDGEESPSCFDLSKTNNGRPPFKDSTYGLKFAKDIFQRVGVGDRWGYFDGHVKGWRGPLGSTACDVIRDADILFNVSNAVSLRDRMLEIPRRALVDTDPVFEQVRQLTMPGWRARSRRHNVFFTFGENYGHTNCSIPMSGQTWQPTRQPIVVEAWPQVPAPKQGTLTTVMSWKSYDPSRLNGVTYGLKSDSFDPYFELPDRVATSCELAIDDAPQKVCEKLRFHHWGIKDAFEVSKDPWTYQQYIQQSKGEFGVAKHAYVVTHSGWFSERSACYLAAGRPVVTQESGFSEWIDTGDGLLSFRTAEEAIDAIEDLNKRYRQHCEAARSLAMEYFDYRKVLPRLVEYTSNSDLDTSESHFNTGSASEEFEKHLREVTRLVPESETIILVDDNQWGIYGSLGGRRCLPFLERHGVYWGIPETDDKAIHELERMKREGAGFLLFAPPASWWLNNFKKFREHLTNSYESILEDPPLQMFDLRGQPN